MERNVGGGEVRTTSTGEHGDDSGDGERTGKCVGESGTASASGEDWYEHDGDPGSERIIRRQLIRFFVLFWCM